MEIFKSKKIGIFSDIHIGYGQDSPLWHDTVLDFGKWSAQKFESLGISEIAIPGDIFHSRDTISVKTLNIAKKFFDIFKEFNLVISTGNHDCHRKMSSEIHSLSMLSEWSNIEIVDQKPRVFRTSVGKTISFTPWATEVKDMPITDIMFSHLDIQSFYMNGYKLCEKGFLSEDLFKKSKYIISGHFHKRDHREYTDGTILYVGSPYQMNFGEVGDDRGIYIFDLEKETFEFVENNVSPKHKKIKVSDLISKKIGADILKTEVPNNLVRLIIDAPITPDIQSILLSKLQNLGPKDLKPDYCLPDTDVSISGEVELEGTDVGKILDEYVEATDYTNKVELKEYLGELYKKVKKD